MTRMIEAGTDEAEGIVARACYDERVAAHVALDAAGVENGPTGHNLPTRVQLLAEERDATVVAHARLRLALDAIARSLDPAPAPAAFARAALRGGLPDSPSPTPSTASTRGPNGTSGTSSTIPVARYIAHEVPNIVVPLSHAVDRLRESGADARLLDRIDAGIKSFRRRLGDRSMTDACNHEALARRLASDWLRREGHPTYVQAAGELLQAFGISPEEFDLTRDDAQGACPACWGSGLAASRDAADAPAPTWTVQWREASWPAGSWTEIACVSSADAIQVARRIYWDARSGGWLVPAIRVMDGIGSTIKGGEFDGCHSLSVYNEDSPEITRYWRVVYGPKQEAFVGTNVPVWRVIGTLKSEEINPANIAAGGWYLATHGPLASLSPDEVVDACTYYGEHKAEIDAIIAGRAS